jgi:hypothetical protein
MTAELHADDWSAHPASEPDPGTVPRDRHRPNVSGDLPTVLEAAPMFRRVVAGYDRFQVDTYVRWAEDELAAAALEREHLVARHLETWADLEEARQLLSHSSGGGEFLQLSRRIGTMLAGAADEAERIRAEAKAARAHAAGQATRAVARAEKALADAEAEAGRLVAEAATEVENATARARDVVARAEQTGLEIRAEAEARLAAAMVVEQRAAEHADRVHRQAEEVAAAARLQARDEIVRMLHAAREQRRRTDDEAAAIRARLDREAATRTSALLAEVATLELRLAALDAELLARRTLAATQSAEWTDAQLGRFPLRLRWRSRSLRAR